MWKGLSAFWVVGGVVFLLDQWSKKLIQNVSSQLPVEVIEGFFRIVYARNTGIAFSFFSGNGTDGIKRLILVLLSVLAICILHWAVLKLRNGSKMTILSLALIFGGALGNLADRLYYGYVIDFLDFYIGRYHWPAFNLADSAITVGASILIIKMLIEPDKSPF